MLGPMHQAGRGKRVHEGLLEERRPDQIGADAHAGLFGCEGTGAGRRDTVGGIGRV